MTDETDVVWRVEVDIPVNAEMDLDKRNALVERIAEIVHSEEFQPADRHGWDIAMSAYMVRVRYTDEGREDEPLPPQEAAEDTDEREPWTQDPWIPCPVCGGVRTTYAAFSGGKEIYCYDCDDNHGIPADQVPPRLRMMQEGRFDELRAEMSAELDRRYPRDLTQPATDEPPTAEEMAEGIAEYRDALKMLGDS